MVHAVSRGIPTPYPTLTTASAKNETTLFERIKTCFWRVIGFLKNPKLWITLSTGAMIFSLVTHNYLLTKIATVVLLAGIFAFKKEAPPTPAPKVSSSKCDAAIARFEGFIDDHEEDFKKIFNFTQLLPAFQKINKALIPLIKLGLIKQNDRNMNRLLQLEAARKKAVNSGNARERCVKTMPKEIDHLLPALLADAQSRIS